MYNNEVVSRLL